MMGAGVCSIMGDSADAAIDRYTKRKEQDRAGHEPRKQRAGFHVDCSPSAGTPQGIAPRFLGMNWGIEIVPPKQDRTE
jgi:hypothetical protein